MNRRLLLCALLALSASAHAKPLKVYILVGQSNMEGHAKVETFDYIGDDPATAPLLKKMRGADGRPTVCDGAWISYLTGSGEANGEGFGKLTAGYGSRRNPAEDGGKIGPEFTFGLTMDAAFAEPVLIIKTAWGGKSLNTDFRPPSAGPYEFNSAQLEGLKRQGKDIEQAKAEKAKATGRYYRLMIEHVKQVLADPRRVMPDYDPAQGWEIAGLVWFQGWNDMVDGGTYPDENKPGRFAKYGEWMADFIRDVRKDLNAPRMPFVIGVMGVGGVIDEHYEPRYKAAHQGFRDAMAAPAGLPEFRGNVVAVQTGPFWDKPLELLGDKMGRPGAMTGQVRNGNYAHVRKDPVAAEILARHMGPDGTMTKEQIAAFEKEYRARIITPEEEAMWKRGASNAGYHYLGCAKTFALMGQAFAEALLRIQETP